MAVMIPNKPRECRNASREKEMFSALERLPDDYYVVHSLEITSAKDNKVSQSETDFLIFNPKYGMLFLEAKAGNVSYSNGRWQYETGRPMSHGGPFHQAARNQYRLMDYFDKAGMERIRRRCKFLHGVWFPSIPEADLRSISLPPETCLDLILPKEALDDGPEKYVRKMFQLKLQKDVKTSLSSKDVQEIMDKILCPCFNLVPIPSYETEAKKSKFFRLLREQMNILCFLADQKTAVINGVAGTGKTVIALEKAKIHARNGEPVLFLCFNSKLRDFLKRSHSNEEEVKKYVSFFTIDQFVNEGLGGKGYEREHYDQYRNQLTTAAARGKFPYHHVIIDEGQDFGIEKINDSNILSTLRDIVVCRGGTFFVFYDKMQLIQSREIPDVIKDADSKVTLYKNCVIRKISRRRPCRRFYPFPREKTPLPDENTALICLKKASRVKRRKFFFVPGKKRPSAPKWTLRLPNWKKRNIKTSLF